MVVPGGCEIHPAYARLASEASDARAGVVSSNGRSQVGVTRGSGGSGEKEGRSRLLSEDGRQGLCGLCGLRVE